jgi:exodeoxyribonuclease-5
MTTLSTHQEQALRTIVPRLTGAFPEPLTYLAGYAGTGKSTLLPFILEESGISPNDVWFCAPTGKAAKVMRSKLKAQKYPNSGATTIHSAIYRAKPAPIATLEADLETHQETLAALIENIRVRVLNGAPSDPDLVHKVGLQKKLILRLQNELSEAYREDKINFQINPDSAVQLAQLIVVDEASMVGKRMAADLMNFNVPILAMGDPGQLPPIEDDAGLTAGKPDFFLTEIHRQAQDNPIIYLSMLAREGKDLPYGKYGDAAEVIERTKFEETYTDITKRPQFLCGTNKSRWKTNQFLRQDFGFVHRAGDMIGPQLGEPLIVKRNMKEYPNLVNGTECTALSSANLEHGLAFFDFSFECDEGVEYRSKSVYQGLFEEHFSKRQNGFTANERAAFRAKRQTINMDWGFCFTVHAGQGSQWDDVVLIDESYCFRKDADRHLYTGVTRAAKTLKVLR